MTDKNKNTPDAMLDSRRRSFKKILGVGGVMAGSSFAAGQWTKPVVNAVLLPAHAQTSGVGSLTDPCTVTVVCTGQYEFQVNVNGFVEPATEGVAVDLAIQFGVSFEELGSPETFGSDTTNTDGEYSATNNYEVSPGSIRAIQVTATLPDFPEAGEAPCGVHVNDDGPHSEYSDTYFCSSSPQSE